jgi:hypothetical protein
MALPSPTLARKSFGSNRLIAAFGMELPGARYEPSLAGLAPGVVEQVTVLPPRNLPEIAICIERTKTATRAHCMTIVWCRSFMCAAARERLLPGLLVIFGSGCAKLLRFAGRGGLHPLVIGMAFRRVTSEQFCTASTLAQVHSQTVVDCRMGCPIARTRTT